MTAQFHNKPPRTAALMEGEMANNGIMHLTINGRPLCGTRRAIMGVPVTEFQHDQKPCKRCLAKFKKMPAPDTPKRMNANYTPKRITHPTAPAK